MEEQKYTPRMTIIRSLCFYPILYKSKSEVLDHLFLSVGNGYEWKNGYLMNFANPDMFNVDYYIKKGLRNLKDLPHIYKKNKYLMKYLKFNIENVEDIVNIYNYNIPLRNHIHEKYSAIMNVPDDVSELWFLECFKFIKWMKHYFVMKSFGCKPDKVWLKQQTMMIEILYDKFASKLKSR